MTPYASRRLKNGIYIGLCYGASAFGLAWLVWILGVLVTKGAAGLSLTLFVERTLSPGSGGGLMNAILGSAIMTLIGVVVGTPIGILAGTYLAEYGSRSRLAFVVRFINDILLSAPSIVIGLFVYQVVVVPMGHFSAIAGALALAIIVIPVVVRTTEDMLRLVPTPLREASAALGMPKSMVVQRIAYKAAKAGLTTGVLLAVSRISGETAPLLFTALNNSYTSFNLNTPMASLPYVIYRYAGSAYGDWQQLAWSGALIITLAVLSLSITARTLGAPRTKR
jgi:phosphate transport system permease protein